MTLPWFIKTTRSNIKIFLNFFLFITFIKLRPKIICISAWYYCDWRTPILVINIFQGNSIVNISQLLWESDIYVNSRAQLLLDSNICDYRFFLTRRLMKNNNQRTYKNNKPIPVFDLCWCSCWNAYFSKISPKPFRRHSRYSCLKHILCKQIFLTFSEKLYISNVSASYHLFSWWYANISIFQLYHLEYT